jgi:hypothetical protein
MKICLLCGKEVASYQKFCKYCGAPVKELPPPPTPPPSPLALSPVIPDVQDPGAPPLQRRDVPPGSAGIPKNTLIVIAAVAIICIVAACLYFVGLPGFSGTLGQGAGSPASMTQIPVATTAAEMTTLPTSTTVPTPTPITFPDALPLKQWFTFGKGTVESQATVYKFWVNDTYQWHNDMDARWYTQKPRAGKKYLLVFVNMVNRGTTRVWYPKAESIVLHYDGMGYSPDPTHYIPEKSGGNLEATPVEIREVQYYPKQFGAEYVEDFGLSHGTKSDFVYPGESNAIDGYIIYEVPSSLTADKSYVEIAFNSQDRAVWRLA